MNFLSFRPMFIAMINRLLEYSKRHVMFTE